MCILPSKNHVPMCFISYQKDFTNNSSFKQAIATLSVNLVLPLITVKTKGISLKHNTTLLSSLRLYLNALNIFNKLTDSRSP